MKIYPSILEKTADAVLVQFQNVAPHFSYFQFDIADGKLVANTTVATEDLQKIQPDMTGKTCEFHLMVKNWQQETQKLDLMPDWHIKRVLIHLSVFNVSYSDLPTNYEWGIVINPEDNVLAQYDIISQFPAVQVMSIHPGAQGTPFVPETLHTIETLRTKGYTGEILLDGAINTTTLPIVLQEKYLPDTVCPGSYFKEDVANRLQQLKKLINSKL